MYDAGPRSPTFSVPGVAFGWQVCGSVKDSAGEDLTNDSPDTNQSETVTTATGNIQTAALKTLKYTENDFLVVKY